MDIFIAGLSLPLMSPASDSRGFLMMGCFLETKVLNKMCRGKFSSSYPVFLTWFPLGSMSKGPKFS